MNTSATVTAEMCVSGRDLSEPVPSPDGTTVAFVASWGSSRAIVAVPIDGGPERIVSTLPTPSGGRGLGGGCFAWLPPGDGLVYAATDGALWLQSVPGGAPRRVASHDERPIQSPAVSPDGAFVAYVVDQAEVWRCALATNAVPERLDDGTADFCLDACVSPDATSVQWLAWNVPDMPWDGARIEAVDVATGARRVTVAGGAAQQPRFTPEGRTIAVRDDRGWLNVWIDGEPAVDEPVEHAGPTWGAGQHSFDVSADGRSLAFTRNERGFGRLCVADLVTGRIDEVANGVHGQVRWSAGRLVSLRSGARTPTQLAVYARDDHRAWTRRTLAVGPVAGWDAVDLPEPALVEVEHDGVVLHARRYVAGRGRTLCNVHGGPTDQWQVEFLPRIAYWWSRGWDVLVPDPRGSTGHGRAYQQALNGGWGRLDVDDTAAILATSHERGWSEPGRSVVMGGSSGGMTALGVLGLHHGLAARGVVLYPVTDIADLAARSHRFEAHSPLTLVGEPGDGSLYRQRSPLSYAHRITVPLLVMHGDADPVVPIDQSLALVERIRDAGGSVELHVMDGEGHGFRRPESKLAELELIGAFLEPIR